MQKTKEKTTFPTSIEQINEREFAEMTGGTPTGDHLGFYSDSAFIDYPRGERIAFWTEGPWDDGFKPSMTIGDGEVSIRNSRVVSIDNGMRIVNAFDTEDGRVQINVITIKQGVVDYRELTQSSSRLDVIRNRGLRDAIVTSLADSRHELARDRRAGTRP